MSTGTVLQAERLSVGYVQRKRRLPVLEGIGLQLHAGEVACLLGPNGAGKSTLLRTLVGSQPALDGTVRLDGDDIAAMTPKERARRLSVVLTDRIDVGFLTARALARLGRTPHVGWFAKLADNDHDIVDWALEAAGASSIADRMVHELSDGERQRVMIARALAQQPRLLVLDEPTAFLDVTRRVELVALLRRLAESTGLAVLMSTHEVDLALRNADHVWLVHSDGRFDAGGPEDLALAGRLQIAFASDDVDFDHRTGSLVVGATNEQHRPSLTIHGAGPGAWWARRAIHRAGWTIDGAATHTVTVDTTGSWRLEHADGHAAGDDLSSLVRTLRRHRDLQPTPHTQEHTKR